MKLVSLYIENFGGLSQYALDFSQGVTVIQEPNGFGKTTLAEFIRAMFYGFPRKGKTLDKDRRQKYAPWNGAKAGGNLVFELDGQHYRIERTFGAEPRSDTFKLIDLATGKKSSRFSKEIGTELFQLDGDSFERSTYLPQIAEQGSQNTADIQAKLSDLVEDANDVGNFDKALAALKQRRIGFQLYRGSGGTVAEATAKISMLQQNLDRAQAQRDMLEQSAMEIAHAEQEIAQTNLRIETARKQWEQSSAAAATRSQYEDLMTRHGAAEEKLCLLRQRYPLGIPGEQEVEDAQQTAARLALLESSGLNEQELQRFEALRSARQAGLLEEERLEGLAEQNRLLLRRRAALENLTLPEEDRRRMEELNSRFGQKIPSAEEIQGHRDALRACDDLRRENEELAAAPGNKGNLLLVIDIGVILLGIVMQIMDLFLPSIAALAAGAALLIFGILRNRKLDGQRRERIAENEKTIASRERAAAEFARAYSRESDPAEALDEIRRHRDAALELAEKLRQLNGKRSAQEELVKQTEESLYRQLGSRDFDKAIADLRLAREQETQLSQRQSSHEKELGQCEKELDDFFARFGLRRSHEPRKQLQQIRDDGKRQEDAAMQEAELALRLEQFPEVPAEAADPDALKRDMDQLNEERTALTEKLLHLRQERNELQAQADQIPELQDELARWQEKKNSDQQKAWMLDDTMEFLQKAKDSLSTSYMGPIRESFAGYLEQLTGRQERILVTPELQVQLERQGQSRELGYFSAGQADLVMLCMRLALVDALFREEKPFVILDDPFVNLDDERTAQALKLLKELGRERQILYLTCNSSRSL